MNPVAPLLPPSARGGRRAWVPAALAALLVLAPVLLLAAPASAGKPSAGTAEARQARTPWSARALELAAALPVQEGGRVMPLQTWANFTMLRLNELRGARDDEGAYRPALEVVLDVMTRPERAATYPMFVVATMEVLDAVRLPELEGKKKRDRYSYADLEPARAEFRRLAGEWAHKDPKDLSPVEQGVVGVNSNLSTWERLAVLLQFAREPFAVKDFPVLAEMFPGAESVPLSELLPRLPELQPRGGARVSEGAMAVLQAVDERTRWSDLLSLLPPTGSAGREPEWLTPAHVAMMARAGERVAPEHVAVIASLERLVGSIDEPARALAAMEETHERVERLASARGEYDKVPLEVLLTKFDPFNRALYLYILGFLLVALTWVVSARWLKWVAWAPIVLALGIHVTGIVIRCVLRERPPVTTLYETILFIFAVLVSASIALEAINRRGIGFALAPFGGAVGLFIASRYELGDAKDTMPQLVAVLDTNFWLATHVVCIAIGYSSALLASFVANLFVLGRLFGLKRGDPDFYVHLHRMTYGVQAFSLIFSVVGTILGGIWANESWGRFWGWDPKENGALLICLSQIALFHGRMGGYLRATGFAIASIFTGCVVVFSWWGVNLLGVGLHSYGFTSGLWLWIIYFWGFQAMVMIAGMVHDSAMKSAAAEAA
ncbi:MAG TPA: cytochrome c biogenesis protein CcsA [Planctomycetota bacterium]|nr:cytochrome c biogenesis protein CcsA [Planctomycetota bacterium]